MDKIHSQRQARRDRLEQIITLAIFYVSSTYFGAHVLASFLR